MTHRGVRLKYFNPKWDLEKEKSIEKTLEVCPYNFITYTQDVCDFCGKKNKCKVIV